MAPVGIEAPADDAGVELLHGRLEDAAGAQGFHGDLVLKDLGQAEVREEVVEDSEEFVFEHGTLEAHALEVVFVFRQVAEFGGADGEELLAAGVEGEEAVGIGEEFVDTEAVGFAAAEVPDDAGLELEVEEPGEGIGHPVGGDEVDPGLGVARDDGNEGAGEELQGLMNVVVLADASVGGVADDGTQAGNGDGDSPCVGGDEMLGLVLGLLVGVGEAGMMSDQGFGEATEAASGDVDSREVKNAREEGAGGCELDHVFDAADIDGADFIERPVETRVSGAVDDLLD